MFFKSRNISPLFIICTVDVIWLQHYGLDKTGLLCFQIEATAFGISSHIPVISMIVMLDARGLRRLIVQTLLFILGTD